MDGISFVASLHAASLSPESSTRLVLKPVKKDRRHSSAVSFSERAKGLFSKSKELLSPTSSSSSVGSRPSLTISTPRSSEQSSPIDRRKRPTSSVSTSSTSSGLPSEVARRISTRVLHRSPQRQSSDRAVPKRPPKSDKRLQRHTDSTYISTLVDNGYVSPTCSPQRCDELAVELDSDLEPSRASSMLDRDLISLSSLDHGP